jgi:hypothetical protein
MAYSAAGLTRIGGASNGDLWFYTTVDPIADVNTAGYFNAASNMFRMALPLSKPTATKTGSGGFGPHTFHEHCKHTDQDLFAGFSADWRGAYFFIH